MNFNIQDKAAEHIKQEAQKKGRNPHLQIGIRGGGCSGFSYIMEWSDGPAPENYYVFERDGASVFIDPKSIVYLNGSELTFVSTFMGHGFKLVNPNEKSSCGCGSSIKF